MTIVVEMIVDRGMGGGEFLQGLYIPELRHRTLSSPERLVRILGTIVEPASTFLIGSIADYVRAARYDRSRSVTIAFGRPYRFIARLRMSTAE